MTVQRQPQFKKRVDGNEFRLDNVRLSFPSLWEPKGYNNEPGAQLKFHATVLIPKTCAEVIQAINDQVVKCAEANFGSKAQQALARMKAQPNYHILKDGDLKAERDGYAGMVYLHASNSRAPKIFSENKTELPTDDGTIQAGDYVNIIVKLFVSKKFGIVCASFTGLQKAFTGDRFTTSAANADDFDDVSVADGTNDPNPYF